MIETLSHPLAKLVNMNTVRIPNPTAIARLAELAKPARGRVEYVTACRRCGGSGIYSQFHGMCWECGGHGRMEYSHAEWIYPANWTDAQVAEFLAGKAAAAEARAEAKRLKKVDEAEAARSRQSDGFKAVWARFLAGEFDGDDRYGFAHSILSETRVLKPITDKQAEAVTASVARTDARIAEREANRGRSSHVGTVGAKVTVAGKVLFAKRVESDYGASMLVVVETADGDKVSTFATAAWVWDATVGDTVTVTGTVKAHEVYDGEKRTVLTRTKCAEFEAAEKRRCARYAAQFADDDAEVLL